MTRTLTHEQALTIYDALPDPVRQSIKATVRASLARRAGLFITAGHDDRLQLASAAFVRVVATTQKEFST